MKKKLISFVMTFAVITAGLVIPKAEPAHAASTKISSAKDLLAMEENPSGDYYLAKDITVPKNTCLFAGDTPFSGTLDGKGHKLKGYKSTSSPAIFQNAKFAEFKNLSVSNVDIKVNGTAAALVCEADTCSFNNVSVSGTIVSGGKSGDVGAIAVHGNGEMKKCKNSTKITVKGRELSTNAGGLAGDFEATFLKDCSNSGTIKLSTSKKKYVFGSMDDDTQTFTAAGLVAGKADVVASCKNAGDVTMDLNYSIDEAAWDKNTEYGIDICAVGICPHAANSIKASGNTGKIKVVSEKTSILGKAYVAGVAYLVCNGDGSSIPTTCYNTGAVSFSGTLTKDYADNNSGFIGGVFGATCHGIGQCYNKGNISVSYFSKHTGASVIGGVFGWSNYGNVKNCYNTGNVSVKNKGKKEWKSIQAGGLGGFANVYGKHGKPGNASCNYSTGKVSYSSDVNHGLVIGGWEGPFMQDKCLIYNNYYKSSGKAYGNGDTSWKPFWPTGKKVSSITFGNCPKLSSKYWTYSSKYKRLVLKNNKEK